MFQIFYKYTFKISYNKIANWISVFKFDRKMAQRLSFLLHEQVKANQAEKSMIFCVSISVQSFQGKSLLKILKM